MLETNGDAFLVGESSPALRSRTPLRAGVLIGPGEKIETGDNASTLISLLPGVILQVNSNSVVEIDRLLLVKGGETISFLMDLREAQVQLIGGSVYSIVAETYVPTNLQITTPAGLVSASQKSSLYVRATKETVRLINCEGEVSFRGKTQSTVDVVPQGNFSDWGVATGAAVSKFRPVDADAEASQQAKNTDMVEGDVLKLTGKTINTGFGWQKP